MPRQERTNRQTVTKLCESQASLSRFSGWRVPTWVKSAAEDGVTEGHAALGRADLAAFDRIYATHAARLFGFLLRLARRRDIAEDVFQETWCKLASSATKLDMSTDPLGWLLTVARNAYYDQARRERRLQPLADNDIRACFIESTESELVQREGLQALERGLATLSDVDREVLLLVGVEQLSHDLSAQVLGITHAALRKRLSRARERLRAAIEEAVQSLPDEVATPDVKSPLPLQGRTVSDHKGAT
jgi:RNA polymerase sigma-70 factor, ECF subfamily